MLEFKTPPEVGWLFIAILGGIAKFFDSYLKGEDSINITKFIALLFVSGFTGYICASIMFIYQSEWGTIAAGVGGFLGTKIFEIISDFIAIRLGIKPSHKRPRRELRDESEIE